MMNLLAVVLQYKLQLCLITETIPNLFKIHVLFVVSTLVISLHIFHSTNKHYQITSVNI